jgi:hypothetical protein
MNKAHRLFLFFAISVLSGFTVAGVQAEIYNLSTASALFAPAFRGDSNTTWFGWDEGRFFGQTVPASSSRILNNPATSNGTSELSGVELYQNDRNNSPFVMIGSTSGNIYTGSGPVGKQASATLVAPMAPGGAEGFTTIVIQGRTTAAGGPSNIQTLLGNYPVFSDINGTAAQFTIAANSVNQAQWWAQYDLPGYSATRTIGMTFNGGTGTFPISIAQMTVDTFWSPTGYANVQAIPEPQTWILAGLGALAVVCTRFIRPKKLLKI